MTGNKNFAEEHYRRIIYDKDYRTRLLENPKNVLCEEFGYPVTDALKLEVIEQQEDTIVIMIPPKPVNSQNHEEDLERVTQQTLDLLFSTGIGGFFIPDDKQKWILRNMRKTWIKKLGLNLEEL